MFDPSAFMLGCGVVEMTVASLIMSAVGTATAHGAQKKAAKEKRAWQTHQAELKRKEGQQRASAAIAQDIQNREATARKRQILAQETAKAKSRATLSASAGGVSGLSIDHLFSEIESQQGAYMHSLEVEQKLRTRELDRNLEMIGLSTEQQMFNLQQPVQEPSAFAAALNFGAQAASAGAGLYKGGYIGNDVKVSKTTVNASDVRK